MPTTQHSGVRRSVLIILSVVSLALGACAARTSISASPAEPSRSSPRQSPTGAAAPGSPGTILALDPAERARRFVALLAGHDFQTATTLFDDEMKAGLSAGRLARIWADLESAGGALRKAAAVRLERRGKMTAAIVRCELARQALDARVVFAGNGKVTGLWFKPATPPWQPPPYAQQSRFHEEDVLVGDGEWATPGTLAIPAGRGPFPALILVHGSGPNDRDESSSAGPQRVFKDLAWGLASRGIAVLRYDKRTLTHGSKLKGVMQSFTHKEEYVEDALAAVELLRRDRRIASQRIFVLGHSEGGTVAPRIGAASKHISGLIVFAGATRDFATIIIDQLNYLYGLDGKIDEKERAEIEEMKRRVEPLRHPALLEKTPAQRLPFGIPAAYWKDELAHDPVSTARAYPNPMLVLQGERDYQVTMADFAGWKKGLARRKQTTFRSYPKLDHHFVEGEGQSRPEQYGRPGHVAEYVIEDIATWVTRDGLQASSSAASKRR